MLRFLLSIENDERAEEEENRGKGIFALVLCLRVVCRLSKAVFFSLAGDWYPVILFPFLQLISAVVGFCVF